MTATLRPTPGISLAGQRAFEAYIADAVIGDAVGTTDGDRCVGEPPSRGSFCTVLSPEFVK